MANKLFLSRLKSRNNLTVTCRCFYLLMFCCFIELIVLRPNNLYLVPKVIKSHMYIKAKERESLTHMYIKAKERPYFGIISISIVQPNTKFDPSIFQQF